MPARTARYFKKLKKPPLNANMEASNPPATTTVETRSGHVRRLQTSLRLARKGVIVPSTETILYLNRRNECRVSVWQTEDRPSAAPAQPTVRKSYCGCVLLTRLW